MRSTAARIDALQEAPGPEHETAEALARETAALTQAVEDAQGALDRAAEFAKRQEQQTSAGAQSLAEGAAALKTQGAALDKRIRATGTQAQANAGHAEAAAHEHCRDEGGSGHSARQPAAQFTPKKSLRAAQRQRWRPWLTGLAIGAASFVFFVLGAVLQRETDVVSFGDPRHEWNEHVVEHFAPLLAACAIEGAA